VEQGIPIHSGEAHEKIILAVALVMLTGTRLMASYAQGNKSTVAGNERGGLPYAAQAQNRVHPTKLFLK